MTKNKAEAYVVYQGLLIAIQQQVRHLTIIGDSLVIISFLQFRSLPQDE
jgi:hypothetical protein